MEITQSSLLYFSVYINRATDCASVPLVSTYNIIQSDSRLVNIGAGNGSPGLCNKKVTISMCSIRNGYRDMSIFLIGVNALL